MSGLGCSPSLSHGRCEVKTKIPALKLIGEEDVACVWRAVSPSLILHFIPTAERMESEVLTDHSAARCHRPGPFPFCSLDRGIARGRTDSRPTRSPPVRLLLSHSLSALPSLLPSASPPPPLSPSSSELAATCSNLLLPHAPSFRPPPPPVSLFSSTSPPPSRAGDLRPVSIVDERDQAPFRSAIFQVLEQASRRPPSADDGGDDNGGGGDFTGGSTGSLIHLRVTHGQISCEASMSIVCGSHGLIVVTRLYNW